MNDRDKCNKMIQLLLPAQPHLQERWWSGANLAFEGRTPDDVFNQDPKLVVQYLFKQFSGDFS